MSTFSFDQVGFDQKVALRSPARCRIPRIASSMLPIWRGQCLAGSKRGTDRASAVFQDKKITPNFFRGSFPFYVRYPGSSDLLKKDIPTAQTGRG